MSLLYHGIGGLGGFSVFAVLFDFEEVDWEDEGEAFFAVGAAEEFAVEREPVEADGPFGGPVDFEFALAVVEDDFLGK